MRNSNWKTRLGVAALALGLITAACASSDDEPQADDVAAAEKGDNTARIAANQGVYLPDYSGTFNTINGWSAYWDEPGKLAYVYLLTEYGVLYYITVGPPVTMCVGITKPYAFEKIDGGDSSADQIVPAEGVDGAYYGGCDNSTKYAIEAITGDIVQWTVGQGQNELVYGSPRTDGLFDDAIPVGNVDAAQVAAADPDELVPEPVDPTDGATAAPSDTVVEEGE